MIDLNVKQYANVQKQISTSKSYIALFAYKQENTLIFHYDVSNSSFSDCQKKPNNRNPEGIGQKTDL